MDFTKVEMQEELMDFLRGFAQSVRRVYWIDDTPANEAVFARLADVEQIKQSAFWQAANDMYDYGVNGIDMKGFADGVLDGAYADAELFLRGLSSLEMFLQEDNVRLPYKTTKVVRLAVARLVLDGGERYTDFDAIETNSSGGGIEYLTLAEVALLANMDERSVRNAASQKQLTTEPVGKRSLVTREEARRWLAGRKGFVPTQRSNATEPRDPNDQDRQVEIMLPAKVIELLELKAKRSGLTLGDYIENQLFAK